MPQPWGCSGALGALGALGELGGVCFGGGRGGTGSGSVPRLSSPGSGSHLGRGFAT